MRIVALGSSRRFTELKKKLAKNQELILENATAPLASNHPDLYIDLNFDNHPETLEAHLNHDAPILISGLKLQLASLLSNSTYIGMKERIASANLLNTFIDRDLWEVATIDSLENIATEKLQALNIGYRLVQDRIGMVSARIIMMIINEACYTLQEGTAGIREIDQAMRLGTNYPKGPFEWADAIGINEVYQTLDAIYLDTREERYKICPLLKRHYLIGQPFCE